MTVPIELRLESLPGQVSTFSGGTLAIDGVPQYTVVEVTLSVTGSALPSLRVVMEPQAPDGACRQVTREYLVSGLVLTGDFEQLVEVA